MSGRSNTSGNINAITNTGGWPSRNYSRGRYASRGFTGRRRGYYRPGSYNGYYSRRRYRRYNSANNWTMNITRMSTIFPKRLITKLVYVEKYLAQNITIGFDDRIWNLNSLFDPDRSGTGHQPMGFDQYVAFYNRYRVFKTDVSVAFPTHTTIGNTYAIVAVNNASAFTSITTAIENPGSISGAGAEGGPAVVLNATYDLAEINGVSRTQYKTDERTQADVASSPVENICLHVVATSQDGAEFTYGYTIKMTMYVELFDPYTITPS